MALVSTICPECKASIKLDDSKPFGFCLSCGSKIALSTAQQNNSGPGMEQLITNYAQLALNAAKAGNYEQSEMYCNKIIELDGTKAAAWALKATAVGWQSTMSNIRIDEMILCYNKALQYTPDESSKRTIRNQAVDDLKNTTEALFKLQADRFARWPDAEEALGFKTYYLRILNSTKNFLLNIGSVELDDIVNPAALQVSRGATAAYSKTWSDYSTDNEGHPGDYAFKLFLERCGYIDDVLQTCVLMFGKDYANVITMYDNMITIHNACINAKSYQGTYVGDLVGWYYQPNLTLNESAISQRRRIISDLNSKKSEAQRKLNNEKAEAQRKRNDDYWSKNASLKTNLQNEKRQLDSEISSLNQKLRDVDNLKEIVDMKDELETLKLERQALGALKFKEKKEKDAQIATLEEKLNSIVKEKKDAINRQLDAKKSRLQSVTNQLTRNY